MSKGEIQLILGPMFSGKSTELLRRLSRYKCAGKKIISFKYQKDTRYEKTRSDDTKRAIKTHDGQSMDAYPCDNLFECIELIKSFDVIGVDEGQFLPDIVDASEVFANMGKIVIIAAIDGNFKREPFGNILNLIPKAEKVKKLKAICIKCNWTAAFTERITKETKEVLIGGEESYAATCRNCHKINVISKSSQDLDIPD